MPDRLTSDDDDPAGGGKVMIAEYVLGLLDGREHDRVAAGIAADPRLAAEETFWRSRFAHLDQEFAEAPAPAQLFDKIEGRLDGQAPASGPIATLWNSLALWRGLAAGALAVAVVAGGLSLQGDAPTSSGELAVQLVAALEAEGSDVKFLALYDGVTGDVRLTGLSGEVAAGQDFELWAIQGGDPISMGVIEANAHSVVPMSETVRSGWGAGSILAITVEPLGGSPTGGPTGPVVAQGAATVI